MSQHYQAGGGSLERPQAAGLADVLELVLDKGVVIAGDIKINLLEIELLTIKLRLLIASVDRAKEMGINWWESDPTLSSGQDQGAIDGQPQDRELARRVAALEELTAGRSREQE